jgi:hypothetical protein
MRPPISLADLAQSFDLLRPQDEATRRRVADALGFAAIGRAAPRLEEPTAPQTVVAPRPAPRPAPLADTTPFDDLPVEPVGPEPQQPQSKTQPILSFELAGPTRSAPSGGVLSRPGWWERITVIERQADPARIPPPDPLLLPIWSRTTYMQTLSTTVLEGRLDISRLVDLVAKLEAPAQIPRLPWLTMRNGVQILVDYGDAMMPFRNDQRRVVREVQELAGGNAFFEVFLFRGAPARWAQPLITRRGLRAYELPPPGAPVLLLTDLGIGALAAGQSYVAPEEWQTFARSAAMVGCPTTAYVPYQPHRWPPLLRNEMSLVHWHHARGAAGARAVAPTNGAGEARRLLEELATRNPQAAALAHLASLASRVELSLLRELRLTLLPAADGGAEADLWFSPLASVRNETVLLLRPEAAHALRRSLFQSDPALYEDAWRIVDGYRQRTGAFEGTRLEEKINYWLAQEGPAAMVRVEELLRRAVKTVFERGEQDDEGLALWSIELLDSLPAAARNSEAGRDLGVVAGFRLDRGYVPSGALPDDIGSRQWLIPVDVASLPAASLWVGREAEGLVLADQEALIADGQQLEDVPATTPRVVWLSWDDSQRREKVSILPGQKTGLIPTGEHVVTIETFTGLRWTLTPTTAESPIEEAPHTETVLNLSGRELAALPAEVFSYPNLKELDLSRNLLETLPPEIGRLASLEKLILDGNRLAELPPEIGMLVNLEELHLAENKLRSLPAVICTLPHLRHLDLHANQLVALPDNVGELQQLRRLDLRDNHLDTLPATLSQLAALETLDLRGNPLSLPANILERIDKPQAILDALAEKKPAGMTRASLFQRLQERAAEPPTIEIDLANWIRRGRCVPILGGWTEFEFALGIGEQQLCTMYADHVGYPYPPPYGLEHLIEYGRTTMQSDWLGANLDFLTLVKNVVYKTARQAGTDQDVLDEAQVQVDRVNVTHFANLLGYPRFEGGTEDPLLLLAALPLPVYVTTSYFQFLEDALRKQGKAVRTASYRPEEETSLPSELALDPSYEPSVGEPLVYHLFGVDTAPSTLILSEDDYLRYLMEVSRGPELIPPLVRRSLAESSLLFLGHDLDDLRWRILDHAIRLSRREPLRSLSVFTLGQVPQDEKREKLIRETLERSDLTLFWGSPAELLKRVYSATTSA